jgi:hypothetical protein
MVFTPWWSSRLLPGSKCSAPKRGAEWYPGLRLKMRFSTARLILAVIPVGLFAASVILTREHGPYYQRNNLDPEYNYLLNSLSLLTLHAPTHNDHPGVTLQILGAAVEWLKWFGGFLLGSRQSLSESVLSQPESYLHAMNVVLNVLLSGALYWSANAVYRLSKSLSAPLVLQVTLLVYHQSFLALPRVSPEPLLMAEGLALMALLAPAVLVAQQGEGGERTLARRRRGSILRARTDDEDHLRALGGGGSVVSLQIPAEALFHGGCGHCAYPPAPRGH